MILTKEVEFNYDNQIFFKFQDIDLKSIIWSAIRYPAMSIGVIVRIHCQALRLWFKGVQFHSKPTPPSTEVSK